MTNKIDFDLVSELIKTKSLKQIAVQLGVSYNRLYNFCQRNNLKSSVKSKVGRKFESEEHIDEVVKYYLQGMSQPQIAKKIGVCQKTVHNIIKKAAHHLRTRSESAKLREEAKGIDLQRKQAAAANAVRHAIGILNMFS